MAHQFEGNEYTGRHQPLFVPLQCNGIQLKNRIVMAPMTREQAPNGIPTDAMARYYSRRAAGGAGLIITEGSPPNLAGAFGSTVPRLYGADALSEWRNVVAAVHENDSPIMAQIWHVGAFEPSFIGMQDSFDTKLERFSPSGLAGPDRPYGKAMKQVDIESTIDAYADAAASAQQVGFDGIEIHAAHGYLLDQFFWGATNQRTDRYGGELSDRARFATELIAACRRRCGPAFPISFRFSQWKQLDYGAQIVASPKELETLLRPLADVGVTMFHCSTRRFWEPAFAGSERSLAAWTRHLLGLPVIAVGSVTLGNDFKSEQGKIRAEAAPQQIELINQCIERGDFDLIAIGRALLANSDWAHIVRDGRLDDLKAFEKKMIEQLL